MLWVDTRTCCFDVRRPRASPAKGSSGTPVRKYVRRFLLKHWANDLYLVISVRKHVSAHQMQLTTGLPSHLVKPLGSQAKDHPPNARPKYSPGTHGTGLGARVERGPPEPIGVILPRGVADEIGLRVSRAVARLPFRIAGPAQDRTVGGNQHGAERRIACRSGIPGLPDGRSNE